MIISHKHKFIFIKTRKTAGTSIEIALSKFCGPDDVITPIRRDEEPIRRDLGYLGPRNYLIPWAKYTLIDVLTYVKRRGPLVFWNHAPAAFVRGHVDRAIWDSYYKFCFERNPWDKTVSSYYWEHKQDPRPSISEFIQHGKGLRAKSLEMYAHGSRIIVDKVFKFEELNQAMVEIRERLRLPETPLLPRAKGNIRVDKRHYREILSPHDADLIAKAYRGVIEQFNYVY